MPGIGKFGSEFLVNTVTAGDQFVPVTTALDDGRFIVVWRNGGDGLTETISAQFFNADGTKSGVEFQIDTGSGDRLNPPAVAVLADGKFVISWTALGTPGDNATADIRARIFEANGTTAGAEFTINNTKAGGQFGSALSALDDGRFVSMWADNSHVGPDKSGFAIRGQVFNADGTRSGAEFQVNTTKKGDTDWPKVTSLDGGRFVAVWMDGSRIDTDDSWDVRGQVFNADGSKSGAEFLVSSPTYATGVLRFDILPTVTTLVDGRFAVAWQEETNYTTWGDQDRYVNLEVYNIDGTRVDDASDTLGSARGFVTDLSMTALAGGGILAAWIEDWYFDDYDGLWRSSVRTATSDMAGNTARQTVKELTAVGDSATPPDQILSSVDVTTLADGRVMVTWDEVGGTGDASGQSVHAQILDPRSTAVQLNGTLANDQFVGTAFGDSMAGSFGNDSLTGAAGDDILAGDSGADSMIGGRGNDRLSGGDGNDFLSGGLGSDVLDGGAGDDTMNGGVAADAMIGGTGNDTYVIDIAGDIVLEDAGGGVDVVTSATVSINLASYLNVENMTLSGTLALAATGDGASNTIIGNAGSNVLIGLAGNDTINGGRGNDLLRGGVGIDSLTGGLGSDRFVFLNASEAAGDVIVDFAAGADDFVLNAFMAGGTFIGSAAFSAANQVRYTVATGLLQGDIDGNGTADWSMTLVNKAALTTADFLF